MSSFGRPVCSRYRSVWRSTGKSALVAPYSGHMFETVARSATAREDRPSPVNSMNLFTTPFLRKSSVSVSTRSVAVVPTGSWPLSFTPTTTGHGRYVGWPSIAASASMPPTPQPSTPRPLTIVVCEPAPKSVSGIATPSRPTTDGGSRPRRSCHLLGIAAYAPDALEKDLHGDGERPAVVNANEAVRGSVQGLSTRDHGHLLRL